MMRARRLVIVALCSAVTLSAVIPAFIEAETPAAPKAGVRDLAVINAELKDAGSKFMALVPSVKSLGEAKFRTDVKEKAVPVLQKIAALLDEISEGYHEPMAAEGRNRYLAMAVALGDAESAKKLETLGASKDSGASISAKSALALGRWIQNSEDAKAQDKILNDYTVLAKADPKEDKFTETLMVMSQLGPANDELAKKAVGVIHSTLTGPEAEQANAHTAEVNKRIVVAGRTTTDARFTSTSMKGKVILVDFWATWCGPCRESMPELKKLYQTYHDQGLEIIGVDNDGSDDKVNSFAKENALPWVQLREQSQTDDDHVHPLTKKWDVEVIPTTFLVDRKGILRYIENPEAPGDVEGLIKKYLAEPGPAPTPTPAPKNAGK